MRRTLLRLLLVLDAAALFLIGILFLLAPGRALVLFGFSNTPPGVSFIIGAFGIVYFTLGIGYVFAAQKPIRNITWIQIAIARGAGESLFSLYSVLHGTVTFRQAGFSIVLPALIAIGYLVLYPKPEMPPIETAVQIAPNTQTPETPKA